MKKMLPSPEDIVRDIEFEILLGTIPQENLESAVLSIKSHHNRLWSELSETVRDARLREAFNKVFQLQEMLLVLLQEISTIIGALQIKLPEIVNRVERSSALGSEEGPPAELLCDVPLPQSSIEDNLAQLMEPEHLRLDLEVLPPRLPLVGNLIRSIKIAFHHLVLFYVNRLGARQVQVNRAYGEQILELIRVVQEQQAQINALVTLLDDLRSRTQIER